MRKNDLSTFMQSVKITTCCWVWQGNYQKSHKGSGNYGRFSYNGKVVRVHRFSYEQLIGPIPAGLTIDHLCRNTLCVNPDHLEAVSSRENTLRGFSPPALNARKTTCPKGHSLEGSNLLFSAGTRRCKICRAVAWQLYNNKRRAKKL